MCMRIGIAKVARNQMRNQFPSMFVHKNSFKPGTGIKENVR